MGMLLFLIVAAAIYLLVLLFDFYETVVYERERERYQRLHQERHSVLLDEWITEQLGRR